MSQTGDMETYKQLHLKLTVVLRKFLKPNTLQVDRGEDLFKLIRFIIENWEFALVA